MVHQYKLNGYNIVMDANSGSVHSVDEVAYDIISMYENSSQNEIVKTITDRYEKVDEAEVLETIANIEDLKVQGLLFSIDHFEEIAGDLKQKQSVLKAICLHVAHGCNMDCEYCFAGKGEYSGKKGIMPLEVGKASLDYLVRESGTRRHLEVDFFGGEPLLNWNVCKELVAYGRELEKTHDKVFNFTLTTNGVLIDDDVIDFSNKEMGNVVLSMDGRQSTHDRMRKSKTGDGTYDSIINNFKELVDARGTKEYYMRGTYTAYNKDFANDVIHMADLGFKETSIEPVVSDPNVAYALHESDVEFLCEQYEKLANEMLERRRRGEGFNFYHYNVNLTGGPCIYKRVAGCGVGTEYLAVTPTGDLYPCHQFVGDDDMKVGDIYEGITSPEVLDIFRKGNNAYTRDKCKDCWAKLYCAGGCAANNYHSNGDINKVYEFGCELHRKRIECAVMLKVAEDEDSSKVILASRNSGKIQEISEILGKFGMEVVSRDDAGIPTDEVEETGETFEENSYIKAKAIMDIAGVPTIADDSGLMVEVLAGAPGVYSARYAGENATYSDNNIKLMKALEGIPDEKRNAKFVSVITMLFPDGKELVARGECCGKIITELKGDGGFGYDPLFIPEGYDVTFAEMGAAEKNKISHRAKSLLKLEELLSK